MASAVRDGHLGRHAGYIEVALQPARAAEQAASAHYMAVFLLSQL